MLHKYVWNEWGLGGGMRKGKGGRGEKKKGVGTGGEREIGGQDEEEEGSTEDSHRRPRRSLSWPPPCGVSGAFVGSQCC